MHGDANVTAPAANATMNSCGLGIAIAQLAQERREVGIGTAPANVRVLPSASTSTVFGCPVSPARRRSNGSDRRSADRRPVELLRKGLRGRRLVLHGDPDRLHGRASSSAAPSSAASPRQNRAPRRVDVHDRRTLQLAEVDRSLRARRAHVRELRAIEQRGRRLPLARLRTAAGVRRTWRGDGCGGRSDDGRRCAFPRNTPAATTPTAATVAIVRTAVRGGRAIPVRPGRRRNDSRSRALTRTVRMRRAHAYRDSSALTALSARRRMSRASARITSQALPRRTSVSPHHVARQRGGGRFEERFLHVHELEFQWLAWWRLAA